MTDSDVIELTADGSNTIYSGHFQQTYHSVHGALLESRHIYAEGSGVTERLAQQHPTAVLEVGFGLGLNFLLTAAIASEHKTPLSYHAIENRPISGSTFDALHYRSNGLPDDLVSACHTVFNEWISDRPSHWTINDCVQLTLYPSDFALWHPPALAFNTVYLDAFSPDENPECWLPERLSTLFHSMAPGGTLVTYCAKGVVRRNLQAAGFRVERLPGPPGKRETLRAHR